MATGDERERRLEQRSQIRDLELEREEQAREIQRLRALLANAPTTQGPGGYGPERVERGPRFPIIPTIIQMSTAGIGPRDEPSSRPNTLPVVERDHDNARPNSPPTAERAHEHTQGPSVYLGNQVARAPELDPSLKEGRASVGRNKRTKALANYMRKFERYLCATLEAPHGSNLANAVKDAARTTAIERLQNSHSAIEKCKITIANAKLEPERFHQTTIAFAGRVAPLLLDKLPDWAMGEHDYLLGLAEPELLLMERGSELFQLANLLFTLYETLGPQDGSELISMGKNAENPQGALQGLPGNEWPRAIMEWFNDAANAADTYGEHIVVWNRCAAGIVALTDNLWQHLNPRETSELVDALKANEMRHMNPERTAINRYVEQLAAVLRNAKGIQNIKPAKGQPKYNDTRWGHANANFTNYNVTSNHPSVPNWSEGAANFTSANKGNAKGQSKGKPGKGKNTNTGCFNCGADDHWSRECPNPNAKGNSKGKNPNAKGKNPNAKDKNPNAKDNHPNAKGNHPTGKGNNPNNFQGNGNAPALGGAGWGR
jgi:hypothetical protein